MNRDPLRSTLALSPEDSWANLRTNFGLNMTTPVDMDNQAALIAMRDSILTHYASARGGPMCGAKGGGGKLTTSRGKVTCNKCLDLADGGAPTGLPEGRAALKEYVRLALKEHARRP